MVRGIMTHGAERAVTRDHGCSSNPHQRWGRPSELAIGSAESRPTLPVPPRGGSRRTWLDVGVLYQILESNKNWKKRLRKNNKTVFRREYTNSYPQSIDTVPVNLVKGECIFPLKNVYKNYQKQIANKKDNIDV